MKEKKLIIYGTGAQAEIAYSYFETDSKYTVAAFTVEQEYHDKDNIFGLPVLKFEDIENHIDPNDADMFVAVGPYKLNTVLEDFCDRSKAKGYKLASYFSSAINKVFLPEYGENSFIDHTARFHPYVKLGRGVTLHNAGIGHHSVIGDFSFLSSALLGGKVIVEDHVYIGMGAVIRDNICIGKGSIIGMGCVITKDVEPYSVYSNPGTTAKEGVNSRDIELFKRR